MLRGRPRLVRAVPRRPSYNARIIGRVRLLLRLCPSGAAAHRPPPSSVSRFGFRRVGGGSRTRTPPPTRVNTTPPKTPTPRARGAPSPSAPRAAAAPSSGRRAAPHQTGNKASKSQNPKDAQKTSAPRAHSTPPLTPPRRGRGGAGRLRRRGIRFFSPGGAAGKDSTARVVGKAPLRRFAALPSSLAAQKQKTPRPLPAKKNEGRGKGKNKGTAPRWGPQNQGRETI